MADDRKDISLKTVIGGFLKALRDAKHMGDIESAELYKSYNEKILLPFSVPAFTISDVDIELRFSIVEPPEETKKKNRSTDLKINVETGFLKGLEAHQISLMRIKITPVDIKVIEDS